LWIDRLRHTRKEILQADVEGHADTVGTPLTRSATAALFERAAPQERAAVVLKDVFDFSLEEIAELLSTTVGAAKSALHRGRQRIGANPEPMPHRNFPASAELIDRFIAAFVARDVATVTDLLLDCCTWEVQGVGGERGKKTIWLNVAFREGIQGSQHLIDRERIAAFSGPSNGKNYLGSVFRFEETDGRISRIINYGYCADTMAYVADRLDLVPAVTGYHQSGPVLDGMIANAQLPWSPEHLSFR